MENRFSIVFFACCASLSFFFSYNFVSKFWSQHRGAELGVSADIFGNYDVVYEEGSERHEVKDSAEYGILFCRRLQQ